RTPRSLVEWADHALSQHHVQRPGVQLEALLYDVARIDLVVRVLLQRSVDAQGGKRLRLEHEVRACRKLETLAAQVDGIRAGRIRKAVREVVDAGRNRAGPGLRGVRHRERSVPASLLRVAQPA